MKKNKPRHIKTIRERYGADLDFTDKESVWNYRVEVMKKINDYISYNQKKAVRTKQVFMVNLHSILLALDIPYKGVLYLEALGKYEEGEEYQSNGKFLENGKWVGYYDSCDAYFIQSDDHPSKRVALKSDYKSGETGYMEYTKYYVMKVSTNGWTLLFFQDFSGSIDWALDKDNILMQGNIGTLVD